MPRDYYDVLGVERNAGEAEIKKAFRRVARELHPDVNKHDPAAEEKFKEAAEAYEVLSDPDKRQSYDTFGHDGLRGAGPADFHNVEDILGSIFGQGSSVFADLFGFGPRGPARGGDVAVAVEIGLEDVVTGTSRQVTFEAVSTCERCNGNAAEPGTPIVTCETCDGAGSVRQVSRTPFGQMVSQAVCGTCGGGGKVPETPCVRCNGHGRELRERNWDVEVPAGIDSGQRIRIAGAGHAGEAGAADGDLYIEVSVRQDPRFERHGDQLLSVVPVSVTRAMLGGKVTVETLNGEREIEVPAGAQQGERLKLRGEGLPSLQSRARGDHHVVLDVVIPKKLNRKQRDLAEQLDETLGDP